MRRLIFEVDVEPGASGDGVGLVYASTEDGQRRVAYLTALGYEAMREEGVAEQITVDRFTALLSQTLFEVEKTWPTTASHTRQRNEARRALRNYGEDE